MHTGSLEGLIKMHKYTKSHQLYFTNIYINVLIEAFHLLLTVVKRQVSKLYIFRVDKLSTSTNKPMGKGGQ